MHTLSDEVFDMDNSVVKVPVADVRVEHEVKMTDFQRWLEDRADRRGKRLTVREFALSSAWSCPGNVSEVKQRERSVRRFRHSCSSRRDPHAPEAVVLVVPQ